MEGICEPATILGKGDYIHVPYHSYCNIPDEKKSVNRPPTLLDIFFGHYLKIIRLMLSPHYFCT